MSRLKELSFENVYEYEEKDFTGDKITIKVLDSNMECLGEAECEKLPLKDFATEWIYPNIIVPEVEYFYSEALNDEERALVDKINSDELVEYILNKFNSDDTSTLSGIYECVKSLYNYISENESEKLNPCVRVKSINSYCEGRNVGTLMVDYLKKKYDLIFLYADDESDGFWLDKVNFQEIMNNYLCWTSNDQIKAII